MGLDIWFREDIANTLAAADEACGATVAALSGHVEDGALLRAYQNGYRAALSTIALAFGIQYIPVLIQFPLKSQEDKR